LEKDEGSAEEETPDSVKRAVHTEAAPKIVQDHLSLNAGDIDNYYEMKQIGLDYLASKRTFPEAKGNLTKNAKKTKADDMDVDAIWGKGKKGKEKGKVKGKEVASKVAETTTGSRTVPRIWGTTIGKARAMGRTPKVMEEKEKERAKARARINNSSSKVTARTPGVRNGDTRPPTAGLRSLRKWPQLNQRHQEERNLDPPEPRTQRRKTAGST